MWTPPGSADRAARRLAHELTQLRRAAPAPPCPRPAPPRPVSALRADARPTIGPHTGNLGRRRPGGPGGPGRARAPRVRAEASEASEADDVRHLPGAGGLVGREDHAQHADALHLGVDRALTGDQAVHEVRDLRGE